jgi:uncharacterized Zn finger protein
MSNLPALRLPHGSDLLPDNGQWRYRFELRSESSNRIYIVAQKKSDESWGCSCPGWKRHRKCKHLTAVGLPSHEAPYPINNIAH